MKFLLIGVLTLLPIIPAFKYLGEIEEPSRGFIFFAFLWLILAIANIYIEWRLYRNPDKRQSQLFYFILLSLSLIPVLFLGICLYSTQKLEFMKIFAVSCLFPLLFNALWKVKLRNLSRSELIIPIVSVLFVSILFEMTSGFFLINDPFNKLIKVRTFVNSADRSYYYYDKIIDEYGTNIVNSLGFMGAEPNMDQSRINVLLIGDSIPIVSDGFIPYTLVNFPNIAKNLYNKEPKHKSKVEIINASISGYSLEQMKSFYVEKLKGLPHDLLIVSFFIDDISRELSYKKNSIRYSPIFPEWIQDVYYKCVQCRLMFNILNITDKTFYYRSKSYKDAFPSALTILNEIRITAKNRGVEMAVFNIPKLRAISKNGEYLYVDMNKLLEAWCNNMKVPYFDVLPLLNGQDIKKLTFDGTHLTKLGHEVVGIHLTDFIESLL